jgi:hypothetical protein
MHGDFKGDKDFTRLQESFVSDGVHLKCTSAAHVVDKEDVFIRWGEWDEGAFGIIHIEDDELEESLNRF